MNEVLNAKQSLTNSDIFAFDWFEDYEDVIRKSWWVFWRHEVEIQVWQEQEQELEQESFQESKETMVEWLLESWTCQEKVQNHACYSKDWSCWSNWEIETIVAMTKMGSRMTEKLHVSFVDDSFLFNKKEAHSFKLPNDIVWETDYLPSMMEDTMRTKSMTTTDFMIQTTVEQKLSCQVLEKSLSLLLTHGLKSMQVQEVNEEHVTPTFVCLSITLKKQEEHTVPTKLRTFCSNLKECPYFLLFLFDSCREIRLQNQKKHHRNRQMSSILRTVISSKRVFSLFHSFISWASSVFASLSLSLCNHETFKFRK